jgi:hypothetical protein
LIKVILGFHLLSSSTKSFQINSRISCFAYLIRQNIFDFICKFMDLNLNFASYCWNFHTFRLLTFIICSKVFKDLKGNSMVLSLIFLIFKIIVFIIIIIWSLVYPNLILVILIRILFAIMIFLLFLIPSFYTLNFH